MPALALAAGPDTPESLARRLTVSSRTDEERLLAIHRWIIQNIRYDHEGLLSGGEIRSPLACLAARRGVCQAISALFREMAAAVGVDAEEIYGEARRLVWVDGRPASHFEPHSWNRVWIGGRPLWIDATFSLHEGMPSRGDGIFLMDPMRLGGSHRATKGAEPGEPALPREEMGLLPEASLGIVRDLQIQLPSLPQQMDSDGPMTFEFSSGRPAAFLAEIWPEGDRSRASRAEAVVLSGRPGSARLVLSVRSPGWKQVVLYARPWGEGGTYTSFAKIPVHVRRVSRADDLPRIYAEGLAASGTEILEGLRGVLSAAEVQSFRFAAPPDTQLVLFPKSSGGMLRQGAVREIPQTRRGSFEFRARLTPGEWVLAYRTAQRRYVYLAVYEVR